MKAQIGSFDIEWLLARTSAEVRDSENACLTREINYNIPPEIGEAYASRLEVSEGVDLFAAVHHLGNAPFGEMITMFDVRANHPESAFSAQIWLSGMGCHLEYWNGRQSPPIKVVAGPGLDTFRFSKETDATVQIAGGGTSEMRSVYVSESTLQAFLGDPAVNYLLEKLGLNHDVRTVALPMPAYLAPSLKEAMSEQYAGPARRLFAQAKVLEYLGGLVNHVYSSETKNDRRHTTRIRELHDHLLSLEGKLPTLNDLAKTFGLSAKQLNCEFAAEFGESIFSFVTARRLEQAREALQDSKLPIKVISDRLGYSHVNHFNTAFRKKFGYPPGTLRRRTSTKSGSHTTPETTPFV